MDGLYSQIRIALHQVWRRRWLAAAVAWWRAFDLDAKRAAMDAEGVEIGAKQDASAASRKELLETVKAFKRLPDEGKVAAVPGLLKGFQDEVDGLTRRARFAEKAFLTLFKELFVAPDPAPAGEAATRIARRARRPGRRAANKAPPPRGNGRDIRSRGRAGERRRRSCRSRRRRAALSIR